MREGREVSSESEESEYCLPGVSLGAPKGLGSFFEGSHRTGCISTFDTLRLPLNESMGWQRGRKPRAGGGGWGGVMAVMAKLSLEPH